MKIVIGQPTLDTVEAITQFDLIQLIFTTKYNNHSIHFIPSIGTTVIHDARNYIIEEAYNQEFDAVLFIDADMSFNPDALIKLIESDKDICGTIYLNKATGKQNVFAYYKQINDFKKITIQKNIGIIEVGAVGAGFILIKKRVFDKIRKPWFYYEPGVGEDVSFCKRAMLASFKTFINTDIDIGHIGKKIWRVK